MNLLIAVTFSAAAIRVTEITSTPYHEVKEACALHI